MMVRTRSANEDSLLPLRARKGGKGGDSVEQLVIDCGTGVTEAEIRGPAIGV
jgi:hypothetical protein